jgi:bifunctional DNA-binding transcriptional regulator/antitoxin component of YhaV-PrlF toxin-antitoxin module
MARRKLKDKSVRNVQRSRSTYYITIPIEVMTELGWRERQKVTVRRYGKDKLLITDWKK